MTCSLYREKLSLYFEFTTCGCDVIRATAPVQRRGRGRVAGRVRAST